MLDSVERKDNFDLREGRNNLQFKGKEKHNILKGKKWFLVQSKEETIFNSVKGGPAPSSIWFQRKEVMENNDLIEKKEMKQCSGQWKEEI